MGSARGYRLKSKCTLRENYRLKHFNTILNIYRSCYRIRILNLPLVSVPRIVQLHNSFPINEASFFLVAYFCFHCTAGLNHCAIMCPSLWQEKSTRIEWRWGGIVIARGLSAHLFDSFWISRGTRDCYENRIQYPTPLEKKAKHNKIIFHAFSENLLTRILL